MHPGNAVALSSLLQRPDTWRGSDAAHVAIPSIPTGFAQLDALLPGGGWPRGALTEILVEHAGIGELSLLAPALAKLSQDELWIAVVAPPHLPYAPALATAGIDLAKIVMIRPEQGRDIPWAMEQALRSGCCSAVLAWPPFLTEQAARRLQLVAEAARCWGVYFSATAATTALSPAALRLKLSPTHGRLKLAILKRRGGAVPAPLLLDVPRAEDAIVPPSVPVLEWE